MPYSDNLKAALSYARLGWRVFPVHHINGTGHCSCNLQLCQRAGKHPMTKNGLKDATTNENQIIQWWSKWPDANIAIATGKESGVFVLDIDINPDAGKFGDETLDVLEQQHGKLPETLTAVSGGGGQHLFFKHPGNIKIKTTVNALGDNIDIRGDGGYLLLEPSNHISGGNYYFDDWDTQSEPLPELAELPETILNLITQSNVIAHPTSQERIATTRDQFVPENTIIELKDALSWIDPDCDYDTWVRTGMALHSLDNDDIGFDLWLQWSSKAKEKFATNTAKDMKSKWYGFKSNSGLNYQSIFHFAEQAGWKNPLKQTESIKLNDFKNLSAEDKELIALTELADKKQPEYEARSKTIIPVVPFPVPALQNIYQHFNDQQRYYYPHAMQQAVLSVMCTITARRYVSSFGDPAFAYFGIISESIGNIRKIKTLVQEFFDTAGRRKYFRGTEFKSDQQVYKSLLKYPVIHYTADDYGRVVEFAKRQTSGVTERTLRAITEIYHSKKVFLEEDMDPTIKDDLTLYHPAIVLLAMISEMSLPALVKRAEIGRGALEQILMVNTSEPVFNLEIINNEPDPTVLDIINRLLTPIQTGNISGFTPAGMAPQMRTVLFSEITEQHLNDIGQALNELVEHEQYLKPLIYGAKDTLRRLVTSMGAWNNPEAPQVTSEIVTWCGNYVRDHLAAFIEQVKIAGTDYGESSDYQKVLEFIMKSEHEGVTNRQLTRSCYAFKKKKSEHREELLKQLLDDGEIFSIDKKASNNKTVQYFLYRNFVKEKREDILSDSNN